MRAWIPAVVGVLVSFVNSLALSETDVVVFHNDDRLTGEVKSLERGKLAFKTDATDTIRIEWDDVAYLTSGQTLEVWLDTGQRYLGTLAASGQVALLTIATEAGPVELSMPRVVRMIPIESNFRDRLEGDIALGYSFTQANDVEQYQVGLDTTYRTDEQTLQLALDLASTSTDVTETSERHSFDIRCIKPLQAHWSEEGIVQFEVNDQLGVDLRTSLGAAAGYVIRETNSDRFDWRAGLLLSQEDVASSDVTEDSVEGVASVLLEWFRYDEPEFDVSTSLSVIPNLSDRGRVRATLDVELKWEIVKDLFLGVSIYDNYDSDPPAANAEKNDYGIVTSVGWSF